MPPRTLKAPMGVWFSCLTTTSAPVWAVSRGQAYCGVGGTLVRTSGMISSSSARLNMQDESPSDRLHQFRSHPVARLFGPVDLIGAGSTNWGAPSALDRAITKDLGLE